MSTFPERLAALLRPDGYPHPVSAVHLIETHISWLLLTGEFAYKLKRPVRYAFVDLRSAEHRAFLCAEEVRLNRRFAPEVYLDVCPVALEGKQARMAGNGPVVEHAVRMRQFDPQEGLDRLLETGRVDSEELEKFGRQLAAIHATLPVVPNGADWGRPATIRALMTENLEQCTQLAAALGTRAKVLSLCESFKKHLQEAERWMADRREGARVRECHGDLHARNVVRYTDRLIAFDCIEFEAAFRWIDVAEEIAFLLMDLRARLKPRHAHAFLSGYLAQSGDYQACRLLRLYEMHKALVRAKVSALEASTAAGHDARNASLENHRNYLDRAVCALAPKQPVLILMYGLSGSGKTWLALQLAPRLEAVHLRSDVERKRLAGLAEHERSRSRPEEGLYSPETSKQVYAHLARCAQHVLAGGYAVIVDATFGRREDRAEFRRLAAQSGIEVRLVDCHAPREVLETRIMARQEHGADASDADRAVLSWQTTQHEPVLPEEGIAVIDADTTRATVVSEVCEKVLGAVESHPAQLARRQSDIGTGDAS